MPSDDYGNTIYTASWISIGSTVNAALETTGDYDYFAFTPSTSGSYTLSSTGTIDTYGSLYSSSGSLLASDDDAGVNANFQITSTLSAGMTYYLGVRGFSSSVLGSYSITVTPPAVTADSVYSVADASATEGGTLHFAVSRTGTTTSSDSISYMLSNGTATSGSDYTNTMTGIIYFGAGETSRTIDVATYEDALVEGTENFNVTISGRYSSSVSDATAIGTIYDNDTLRSSSYAISTASATEGNPMRFTVTRTGGSGGATLYYYTGSGTATAGVDYASTYGSVYFSSGDTSQTIEISTMSDTAVEGDETLYAYIYGPSDSGTVTTSTATGTLRDSSSTVTTDYRLDETTFPGRPIAWVTNSAGVRVDLSTTDLASVYGLAGGSGADTLIGNAGNNLIWGGSGGSSPFGGGSGGADVMTGGMGQDTYFFGTGDGNDRITSDVNNRSDVLNFYNVSNRSLISGSRSGDDLILSVGTDSVTMEDWYVSSDTGRVDTAILSDGSRYSLTSLASGSSSSSTSQRIVFCSNRDGDTELYLFNPTDNSITQVTNNSVDDSFPSLSPDGTKIAFTSDRDGDQEVYVMDADGRNLNQLTNNSSQDLFPGWLPDSSRIVFTSDRDGDYEVYSMNTSGGEMTQLTNNTSEDWRPAFSPDGMKVAFTSNRDGDQEIYVMNTDGTGITQITNNTSFDAIPAWSPDGTTLAFTSDRDGDLEVYTVRADGTNLNQLTNNTFLDYLPSFSPDGTALTFTSDRDGDMEIYTMSITGTALTQLTNNSVVDAWSDWGGGLTGTRPPVTPVVLPSSW